MYPHIPTIPLTDIPTIPAQPPLAPAQGTSAFGLDADPGNLPTAWASGRTLTWTQRERKRQVDRAGKARRRKDDQHLVQGLRAKVEELTLRIIALEQNGLPQPQPPPQRFGQQTAETSAETTTDSFKTSAYSVQHGPPRATPSGFVGEIPDTINNPTLTDADSEVLPLPHELTVNTAGYVNAEQAGDPVTIQDLFNHIMGLAVMTDRSLVCTDAALNQDALIQGVYYGWENVLNRPYACPLWDLVSRFDSLIYAFTSTLTRLSALSALHYFLIYLSGGISVHEMPSWHRPRPTQVRFQHDLAIDVLPWPGLRERAVLDETVTKSNKFWREIINLFELHWPYSDSEVYIINPVTNMFTFSGLYQKHVRDIKMWRVNTDFFKSFPALYDDIAPITELYRQPSMLALPTNEAPLVYEVSAEEDECPNHPDAEYILPEARHKAHRSNPSKRHRTFGSAATRL